MSRLLLKYFHHIRNRESNIEKWNFFCSSYFENNLSLGKSSKIIRDAMNGNVLSQFLRKYKPDLQKSKLLELTYIVVCFTSNSAIAIQNISSNRSEYTRTVAVSRSVRKFLFGEILGESLLNYYELLLIWIKYVFKLSLIWKIK